MSMQFTPAMRSMGETAQEKAIRRAIERAKEERDRWAEDRVKEMESSLVHAEKDVARQMKRLEEKASLKPWQSTRLAALKNTQKQIDRIAEELKTTWAVGIEPNVAGAMQLGVEDGIEQLRVLQAPGFKDLKPGDVPDQVIKTFSTIDQSAIAFLGNYQLELLGDVSAQLASSIKRAITHGVLTGASIPEITKQIGQVIPDPEAFRHAGKSVFKTAQHRARLIARTESVRAHSEGRKMVYEKAGIKKVRWHTAYDERVCSECGGLDGLEFSLNDVPGPPRHSGCRCSLEAILPGE